MPDERDRSLNAIFEVRVVKVIQVRANRGAGIHGDPIREVTQWWTCDGKLLAEQDHLQEDWRRE